MSLSSVISQVRPYARLAVEDDEFRTRVQRAINAGRSALMRPAPPPTRLQRAGLSVREFGSAVNVYGRRIDKRRRVQQRARRVRAALIGTCAVAVPVLVRGAMAGRRASAPAAEEVSNP